jgi:CyaY protein
MWIAAKSGGYHFARQGEAWIAGRDGSEFFSTLAEAIRAGSGEGFSFDD